jgi:hypothetical protein
MPEYDANNAEQLGHEPLTIRARAVSIAVAVLFGGVLASLALMAGLKIYLGAVRGGAPTVRATELPAEPPAGVPAVDANQVGTLRELRAQEEELLGEYVWIDRNAGVARIPIGRAMEILAERLAPASRPPER